jgi:hypothetical protein
MKSVAASQEATGFSPEEARGIAQIAEEGRVFAETALASADVPRQLREARESLVEEVDQTRRRYESRTAIKLSEERRRELEAEYRAADAALRMFDNEMEKFGGLDGLVRISALGTKAYRSTAWSRGYRGPKPNAYSGRGYIRDAKQPARDPAVIEPGARVHIRTKLVLPNGKWIGGDGHFSKNGSTEAQDGGYTGDPRYSMASSIRQVGDQVEVRPKVMLDGELVASGLALIPSGETVTFTLDNGMAVTATATIRGPRAQPPNKCCTPRSS